MNKLDEITQEKWKNALLVNTWRLGEKIRPQSMANWNRMLIENGKWGREREASLICHTRRHDTYNQSSIDKEEECTMCAWSISPFRQKVTTRNFSHAFIASLRMARRQTYANACIIIFGPRRNDSFSATVGFPGCTRQIFRFNRWNICRCQGETTNSIKEPAY